MLPRRFAPALFGLILSGLMSLLVSGISTYRVVGFGESLAGLWVSAWLIAWLVALPVVLVGGTAGAPDGGPARRRPAMKLRVACGPLALGRVTPLGGAMRLAGRAVGDAAATDARFARNAFPAAACWWPSR